MKTKNEINATIITDWKKEWGKIYKTGISDVDYIWRKIKRKEYNDIMSKEIEAEDEREVLYTRQCEIVKAIVLSPENIEELISENCGLAGTLADIAMTNSGFMITSETEEL